MKSVGKSRITSFRVSKVTVELDGQLPVIAAEFVLEREDGAQVSSITKKRPIPLFFEEKEVPATDFGYFQKPVADALRALLDALEVDTYPELFEGSPTSAAPAPEKPKSIPDDW